MTKLEEFASKSIAAAYDTCHKIYLIGDQLELNRMIAYGYEEIVTDNLVDVVTDWYKYGCELKFIEFIGTDPETNNTRFETVVAQGGHL